MRRPAGTRQPGRHPFLDRRPGHLVLPRAERDHHRGVHSRAVHRLPYTAGHRQHQGVALDGARDHAAPQVRLRLDVRDGLAAGSQRLPRDRLRDAGDGTDGRCCGREDQDGLG